METKQNDALDRMRKIYKDSQGLLYGVDEPYVNDCGVIIGGERFYVCKDEPQTVYVRLVQYGGKWYFGVHVDTSTWGMGYAPMITREAYGTREDAIRAGLNAILGYSRVQGDEFILRAVKGAIMEQQQLSLFEL